MMKIFLVCGGRDYSDRAFVYKALDLLLSKTTVDKIIHGGATGADTIAGMWSKDRNIPVDVYNAEWKVYGKKAGMIRNRRMLEEGKPTGIIAFPGGTGTEGMVNIGLQAGLKVWKPR